MKNKVCIKCGENKNVSDFHSRRNQCKECIKRCMKKIKKKYREKNKEKIKEKNKKYKKKYREENKEKILEYQKKYERERRENDSLYRLTTNIRSLISISFKRGGYTKKSRTYKILGCSFEDFKKHIESQFEDWMNWDNYGLYNGNECYGWDFDHIIPLSSCECEDDIYRLNHYSNLQPLCSYINRNVKKGNLDCEL